jgi:hypothetical protein
MHASDLTVGSNKGHAQIVTARRHDGSQTPPDWPVWAAAKLTTCSDSTEQPGGRAADCEGGLARARVHSPLGWASRTYPAPYFCSRKFLDPVEPLSLTCAWRERFRMGMDDGLESTEGGL